MIDRSLLAAGVRLAGYPPLTEARRTLTPERWALVVARATPRERPAILKRLARWLLVCTPTGRRHAREWLDAGAPRPPVDARPLVHGDVESLPVIQAGLQCLPDCVRALVIERCGFDVVGRSSVAWIGRTSDRPVTIRLGPDATVRTIVHECSHLWHSRFDRPAPDAMTWHAARIAVERHAGVTAQHFDCETLADACAAAWGAP